MQETHWKGKVSMGALELEWGNGWTRDEVEDKKVRLQERLAGKERDGWEKLGDTGQEGKWCWEEGKWCWIDLLGGGGVSGEGNGQENGA